MAWRTLLLALAACNSVYGIRETVAIDGGIPDRDQDEVDDIVDNCIDVGNRSQLDEDDDGFGDACDNCPLIANADQSDAGDGDAIGDACDQHPLGPADCLVLLDSFTDPAQFDAAWMIAPASASIDRQPGTIVITATSAAGILSREYAMEADVQVKAAAGVLAANASVAAVTRGSLTLGYRCALTTVASALVASVQVVDGVNGAMADSSPLVPVPVPDRLLVRVAASSSSPRQVACRVDYGTAVGATALSTTQVPPPGALGVVVANARIELHAVAVYQERVGECPAPVIR